MFHIYFKIGFTRKKSDMTNVVCSHCAKPYRIYVKNVRAMNYCTSCK